MPRSPECRACGAQIRFVKTAASNGETSIPLNWSADPDGNVEIIDGLAHVHGQRPLGDVVLWMPHHATCPNWKA